MWWTGKKPEEHLPFATLPDAKVCSMLYPMCAPALHSLYLPKHPVAEAAHICSRPADLEARAVDLQGRRPGSLLQRARGVPGGDPHNRTQSVATATVTAAVSTAHTPRLISCEAVALRR